VFKTTVLILTMVIYILPSFLDVGDEDAVLIMLFLRDKVVILLLTLFILKGLQKKLSFNYVPLMLVLIATVWYLVNFVVMDIEDESQYNLVSDNG
jgi:hypothetical protein